MKLEKLNKKSIAGRWDLIPSEIIDLFYEAGIARDTSCNLIESLPDDLWPQIQITCIQLDPNSAKVCNSITAILAYLMMHDFKIPEDIDLQLGTAFQYLQGEIAKQKLKYRATDIEQTRSKLDSLLSSFFNEFYGDSENNYPQAANEQIH